MTTYRPANYRKSLETQRLQPIAVGEDPSELDPARFIWMEVQPELSQPLPVILQEAVGFGTMLEPEHIVIRVSNDNHVALRTLLAPSVHPEVEYLMQIDIGKQRRNHRTLRSTHLRILPLAFLHHSRLQPFLDQAENAAVGHAVLDELQHSFVVHVIEEAMTHYPSSGPS
jgi:hypothetical protein